MKHNRITQQNPRTGALPVEQTAQNAGEEQQNPRTGLLESDKQIYQLVEENVGYAGEQFGENLRFNSETLTNVLYDNIYDLLEEKLDSDEFVNWVAEELVKNGCVFKQASEPAQQSATPQKTEKEEPKEEEVVTELDTSAYDELVQKVYQCVELLKANKLTIFKMFSDVDNQVKDIGQSADDAIQVNAALLQKRDDEIKGLVARIQGNQETIDEYILSQQAARQELDGKLDETRKVLEESEQQRQQAAQKNKETLDRINDFLTKVDEAPEQKTEEQVEVVEEQVEEEDEESPQDEKKKKGEDETEQEPAVQEQIQKKTIIKTDRVVQTKLVIRNVVNTIVRSAIKGKTNITNQLVQSPIDQIVRKTVTKVQNVKKVQKSEKSIFSMTPVKEMRPLDSSQSELEKPQVEQGAKDEGKKEEQPKSKKISSPKSIIGSIKKLVQPAKPEHGSDSVEPAPTVKPLVGKIAQIDTKPLSGETVEKDEHKTTDVEQSKPVSILDTIKELVKPILPPKPPSEETEGVPELTPPIEPPEPVEQGLFGKIQSIAEPIRQRIEEFKQKSQKTEESEKKEPTKLKQPSVLDSAKGIKKNDGEKTGGSRIGSFSKSILEKIKEMKSKIAPKSDGTSGLKGRIGKFIDTIKEKFSSLRQKIDDWFKEFHEKFNEFNERLRNGTPKSTDSDFVEPSPQIKSVEMNTSIKTITSLDVNSQKVTEGQESIQPVIQEKFKTQIQTRTITEKLVEIRSEAGQEESTSTSTSEPPVSVEKKDSSKLQVTPNGMCICPICGAIHIYGKHTHEEGEKPQGAQIVPPSPEEIMTPVTHMEGAQTVKPPAIPPTGPVEIPQPTGGEMLPAPIEEELPKTESGKPDYGGAFGLGFISALRWKNKNSQTQEQKKESKERGSEKPKKSSIPAKKSMGLFGFGKKKKEDVFEKSKKEKERKKEEEKRKKEEEDIWKPRKPGLIERTKDKISGSMSKTKRKISNSSVGTLWKGVKAIGHGIAKVGAAVTAVAVGTVKAGVGAVKMVGKGLVKAAKWATNGVMKIAQGIKNVVQETQQIIATYGEPVTAAVVATLNIVGHIAGAVDKVLTLPLDIFTKISWGAIKFIGKKLWQGIKKAGKLALGILTGLFVIGAKFVNKISYYVVKIGKGIKNLAYKFIIKPIASILTTVFGFAMTMVKTPIMFIKDLLVATLKRVFECLSNISQSVSAIVGKTMGFFKKILTNPITIVFLIGALVYFILPHILGWLDGGLSNFKDNVWPKIVSVATTIWNVLTGIFNGIVWIGKILWKAIDWLTNPEGFIANAIAFLFNIVMAIRGFVKKMLVTSRKDSVDLLCMMLAGDYLGIVIRLVISMFGKLWNAFKRMKLFRFIIGIVKTLLLFAELWATWPVKLAQGLIGFAWSCIKGNFKEAFSKLVKPFTDWWARVKSVWDDTEDDGRGILVEDPVAANAKHASDARIAVRSLKMKGQTHEAVLSKMDEMSKMAGYKGNQTIVQRIEKINDLYQKNSEQVDEYNKFIGDAWEEGKGNDDTSMRMLQAMLESPQISQKLMSAFYYYQPQTGKVLSLFPDAYIAGFLKNIRNLVSGDDAWSEKFKTIIEAFDQINKERANIVNQQGDVITDFAEKIKNFDLKAENADKDLKKMVSDLNGNTMFEKVSVTGALHQIKEGDAKTQQIESVTGNKLGTNKLFNDIGPLTTDAKGGGEPTADQFEVKKPEKKDNEIIQGIELPPSMVPDPEVDKFEETDGKTMVERWKEHQLTRQKMGAAGKTDKEIHDAGFDAMTLDEFKQKYKKEHPPTLAQSKASKENQQKKIQAIKLSKDIQAYNNQGVEANPDGFKIGKTPTTLKVQTDGLSQSILVYSPQWRRVRGAAKLSDAAVMLEVNRLDKEAYEKVRKAKMAEEMKRLAEEKEKRRQQQILDYSAKVSGGFIEVKIGEDVEAMRDAWYAHERARQKAAAQGKTDAQLKQMGLIPYSWPDWKKYYRKMHGLPEDGIKRIPFEGKKKERKIDWGSRMALSMDELSKYGVKVSEDGPVMIPIETAMKITSDLLQKAKTVTSIRDGLEVMKLGLEDETKELKRKRENGDMPTTVINRNNVSQPRTQSSLPTPQQQFEAMF